MLTTTQITQNDVISLLEKCGIPSPGTWQDYESAKRIIKTSLGIPDDQYEQVIQWIADYLRI